MTPQQYKAKRLDNGEWVEGEKRSFLEHGYIYVAEQEHPIDPTTLEPIPPDPFLASSNGESFSLPPVESDDKSTLQLGNALKANEMLTVENEGLEQSLADKNKELEEANGQIEGALKWIASAKVNGWRQSNPFEEIKELLQPKEES